MSAITVLLGPDGEPPNRAIDYVDARTGVVLERVAFFADPWQHDGRPYP